ncbi:MAG: hypothetical protein R3290_02075 [Acidimicrobiia bacterium]|nr:hypothetical protein [Acidimicrobiia bacterium]
MQTGPHAFETARIHARSLSDERALRRSRAAPHRPVRATLGHALVALGERLAHGRRRTATDPCA